MRSGGLNVFVEDVRIARRGLDIRVVEHLLHQLEVAGVAQCHQRREFVEKSPI